MVPPHSIMRILIIPMTEVRGYHKDCGSATLSELLLVTAKIEMLPRCSLNYGMELVTDCGGQLELWNETSS